jgi:hypothetical protein
MVEMEPKTSASSRPSSYSFSLHKQELVVAEQEQEQERLPEREQVPKLVPRMVQHSQRLILP